MFQVSWNKMQTKCGKWAISRILIMYSTGSVKRPLHSFNNGENASMTSWTVENRNLLPVLVFIHGGEYLAGSSQLYGPDRFMKEDVVLVTFNYRLGLLGFLSNGEESLPG